jgi:hypothetical protein
MVGASNVDEERTNLISLNCGWGKSQSKKIEISFFISVHSVVLELNEHKLT